MSRFNNVNAVFGPPPNGGAVAAPTETPRVKPGDPPQGAGTQRKPAASLILPPNPGDVTLGQKVGFLILCIYIISGYANEFAIRELAEIVIELTGTKGKIHFEPCLLYTSPSPRD